eukprot:TRINITY_DN12974_c0_g2_i1.p1 TRINITY_DN12974_c0_g2~~TRINITY_DN12974_c0_g2_i1.p1  ORF type:complete len:319 (+),score=56.51 TRINITY_DN12974_c0_g2_i1:63-959(+)
MTALNLDAPALNPEIINHVNGLNGHPWRADYNSYFADKTIGDVVKMLGDTNDKMPEGMKKKARTNSDVPDSFDGRTADEWFGCVHDIRDQGSCGSCWAFSAAEGLTDSFCIASEGAINVVLSPQDLVSCDNGNAGCNGGSGPASSSYLKNYGIVADECFQYFAQSGPCPSFETCPDEGEPTKYYADDYYQVDNDEEAIREETYENGPGYIRFDVYSDFMSYASGVYVHTTGGRLGGHAVHVVGWGHCEESGLDYWLIANSWGSAWGMSGYFKIARGQNECGIEGGYVGFTAAVEDFLN